MNIELKFWSTYVHDHYRDNGCPLTFQHHIPINLVRETMSEYFQDLCLFDKAQTWNMVWQ